MGTNGIEQVFYILARAATKNRTIDGACMGAAPQRGPWPPLSRHCLVLAALRPGFKRYARLAGRPRPCCLAPSLPRGLRLGCGLRSGPVGPARPLSAHEMAPPKRRRFHFGRGSPAPARGGSAPVAVRFGLSPSLTACRPLARAALWSGCGPSPSPRCALAAARGPSLRSVRPRSSSRRRFSRSRSCRRASRAASWGQWPPRRAVCRIAAACVLFRCGGGAAAPGKEMPPAENRRGLVVLVREAGLEPARP